MRQFVVHRLHFFLTFCFSLGKVHALSFYFSFSSFPFAEQAGVEQAFAPTLLFEL